MGGKRSSFAGQDMRQTNSPYLKTPGSTQLNGRPGKPKTIIEVAFAKPQPSDVALDFAGQVLDGRDWSQATLPMADFSNVSANNCNFDNADLFGADFSGASLRNATFTNCDLRGCNFAQTDLDGAVIRDADLRPGKFSPPEACVPEINAAPANAPATEQGVDHPDAISSSEERLVSANFAGADLTGADLAGSNLRKANFSGATLKNASFEYCDLTDTNFLNCDLSRARTGGSNLVDALTALEIEPRPEWFQMTLERHRVWIESNGTMGERATLNGMTLRNLDLSNCDLRGAVLTDVVAIGSNFSGSNLAFSDFSNSKLRGANFEDALLNGANFSGACLAGASLRRASIEPLEIFDKSNVSTGRAWSARFVKTNLEGADFRGAIFKEAIFQNTVVRGVMWDAVAGLTPA